MGGSLVIKKKKEKSQRFDMPTHLIKGEINQTHDDR